MDTYTRAIYNLALHLNKNSFFSQELLFIELHFTVLEDFRRVAGKRD